jgi:MYXO-CTERM domain-containing protein
MDASGPADADPGDPDAGASDASPGGDADVDEDLGVVRDGGERDAEASEVGAADGSEVGDAGRALDADAQPAPDASRDAAVSATAASPMTDLGPSDSATDNAALKGGCGCSTPEGPRPAGSAAWMVLVALFVLRRRAGRRR